MIAITNETQVFYNALMLRDNSYFNLSALEQNYAFMMKNNTFVKNNARISQ